jgi:glycosyltransferase involved in cell wall biosynthesis
LFAGRLAEQKGLFDLLTAISIVSRQGYRFTVDIVGGGVLAKKLGEEVRRLSIEKHVNFHGQTPPEEMSLHYRTAHILILPSLYEGHPLVINEAMSHGMPVIVTRSGGPEYFVEQSMGTVCNPGKAHELADAMATMIRLPSEKLRAMGMAGKDKVGRCCDIDIVAGRYVELFVRAIKSAGR